MNDDKYSKYKTQQGFSSWQEERKYLENKWGKQGRQIHPMNYKEKLKKLKEKISQGTFNETWNQQTTSKPYGNFSSIDTEKNPDLFNYKLYPDLANTSPVHIEINAGEALVIPKGWWHYVRSYEQTFFMNYWTTDTFGHETPTVLAHDGEFNRSHLNLEDRVCVWEYSTGQKKITYKTFAKFLDSSDKFDYYWTVITTNKGEESIEDVEQKKEIVNRLKKPTFIKKHAKVCDVNIGICPVFHQTPLHYDEEDGLLCVTSGTKKIILFPPSDSEYLYPVNDIKNSWCMSENYRTCYNMYHIYDESLSGENSGSLLLETCKDKPLVLSNISQLYNSLGDNQPNSIVYGVKNDMDKLWWELYRYDTTKIISKEIYQHRDRDGESISPYTDSYIYKDVVRNSSGEVTFSYGDIYRNTHGEKKFRGRYLIEKTEDFKSNAQDRYKLIESDMSHENYNWIVSMVNKYTSSMFAMHTRVNETDDLYIQWYGITNVEFLNFLIDNNYPDNLIEKYSACEYNIENEISIVYSAKTKSIKRTAFYGII